MKQIDRLLTPHPCNIDLPRICTTYSPLTGTKQALSSRPSPRFLHTIVTTGGVQTLITWGFFLFSSPTRLQCSDEGRI